MNTAHTEKHEHRFNTRNHDITQHVRIIYKPLPDFYQRVLRKIDEYPFKVKNAVPFYYINQVVRGTFKVNKDECHQILRGLAAVGFIKIRALRGVEITPAGRAEYACVPHMLEERV